MPVLPHKFTGEADDGCSMIWRISVLLVLSLLLLGGYARAQPPTAGTDTAAASSATDWSDPQDLLEKDLKETWKHFSSVENTPLEQVWQRTVNSGTQEPELVCIGDPKGFLYTSEQFDECKLTFEWQYASDPNGNSGVLLFTQNDPRLWPTSIQIQLHQPEAGSIFPSGDAVTENIVEVTHLAKPVGEWNRCQIVSRAGSILVHVNGMKAGEVTGCKPSRGNIAIQSEGSEVRFRKIRVRKPARK